MMVVSASATGLDDFSDKDKVVNKDAVSMLTTLGVINGKAPYRGGNNAVFGG